MESDIKLTELDYLDLNRKMVISTYNMITQKSYRGIAPKHYYNDEEIYQMNYQIDQMLYYLEELVIFLNSDA